MNNFFSILTMVIAASLSFLLAVFFCIYLFSKTEVLSYRLVTIFLSLIFLSNFNAKLLIANFKNKR